MALVADANGVLKGKFTIPANIQAGAKSVELTGSGGSHGTGTFVGDGTLVTNVLQSVTKVTQTYYDPLAQTFTLTEDNQIGGVDLVVTAKGATPITVQIRGTQVGFPNQTIMAEASLQPSQLVIGDWNRFVFGTPMQALANVEYAIVVLCNDPDGAVAIAELGKWDTTTQRWVTQQPYQVGVLLSSSNASTWTAHQDRDLTFRLLARRYTQPQKDISLGTIPVTNATDLVVLSMVDNPATGADSEIILTMPDDTQISSSDGQFVRFSSNTSGNVKVTARIRSTQKASAVLYPGSQLAVGTIGTTADYVSRAIDAAAAGCIIRVIYDGDIPSGAAVQVYYSGVDAGDTWVQMNQQSGVQPVPLGGNIYEYNYLAGTTAVPVKEARIRIKLVITGGPAARPYVYNLRVSVMPTVA